MVRLVSQLTTKRPKKSYSISQSIKSAYTMISCNGELLIDWAVGLYIEIFFFGGAAAKVIC